MKKLTPKNGVIKTTLIEVLDTCIFQTCEASYRNVKKATRHKAKAKAREHKAKAIGQSNIFKAEAKEFRLKTKATSLVLTRTLFRTHSHRKMLLLLNTELH